MGGVGAGGGLAGGSLLRFASNKHSKSIICVTLYNNSLTL